MLSVAKKLDVDREGVFNLPLYPVTGLSLCPPLGPAPSSNRPSHVIFFHNFFSSNKTEIFPESCGAQAPLMSAVTFGLKKSWKLRLSYSAEKKKKYPLIHNNSRFSLQTPQSVPAGSSAAPPVPAVWISSALFPPCWVRVHRRWCCFSVLQRGETSLISLTGERRRRCAGIQALRGYPLPPQGGGVRGHMQGIRWGKKKAELTFIGVPLLRTVIMTRSSILKMMHSHVWPATRGKCESQLEVSIKPAPLAFSISCKLSLMMK